MKDGPFFAVATTTYNMADTIERTYRSILAQTYKNFYWLVIDNGSTDNTREVVERIQMDCPFEIRYVRKEHGIRATAVNAMLDFVKGDLCVEIHADDELRPDALQIFADAWKKMEHKERYWNIAAHCMDEEGKIVGKCFPEGINRNFRKAVRLSFHTVGEKHYAMNVGLVKTVRFEEKIPEGITYLVESMLWNKMNASYGTWFVNRATRVYHTDSKNRYSKQEEMVTNVMRNNAYYSHMRIVNTCFLLNKKPFREYLNHLIIAEHNAMKLGIDRSTLKEECCSFGAHKWIDIFWLPLRIYHRLKV